jgi:hypothetical protein
MEHFGAAYHPYRKGWIYMTMCEGAEDAPLYLIRDDRKTWAPFADLPFSNIMRVHSDPADPDHILLWAHLYAPAIQQRRSYIAPEPASGRRGLPVADLGPRLTQNLTHA